MMLIDNISYLKQRFPQLYKDLQKAEPHLRSQVVQVEPAKNGDMTLFVEQQGTVSYLHSKYNPSNEAQQFAAQFEDLNGAKHIFFYGLGLGYQAEHLLSMHPDVSFTIYEPNPAVFYRFLCTKNLRDLPVRRLANLYIGSTELEMHQISNDFVQRVKEQVHIMMHPAYERIFKHQSEQFASIFKQYVTNKRSSLRTNVGYEKLWTFNSANNLDKVLHTPNILRQKKPFFYNKPALLVAAGPSLQEELENIRYIKENGLAYIFAVGSANRALIKSGIYPDAVTSYDPNRHNHQVFQEIIEQKIDKIPLIFGSSVGYETLKLYPGPMLHMITSQDTISPYYLGADAFKENKEIISDAPSIAVLTLEILTKLECSHIILVGQNLSYKNNQYYASGIEYNVRPTQMTEKDLENAVMVESVEGEQIYSNDGHVKARLQMEGVIASIPRHIEVINATQGGAKIKGATFTKLETVIQDFLKERVVEEGWHLYDGPAYNPEAAEFQLKKMRQEIGKFVELADELVKMFKKMDVFAEHDDMNQLKQLLPKFDKTVKRFQKNQYVQVHLQPMIRVQFDIFRQSVPQVQQTADISKKARMIIEVFGKLVHDCQHCHRQIGDATYQLVQQSIVSLQQHEDDQAERA